MTYPKFFKRIRLFTINQLNKKINDLNKIMKMVKKENIKLTKKKRYEY